MLLKPTGAGYKSADLTLTFGPGVVRYLDPLSLIADGGHLASEEIELFSVEPTLKFSLYDRMTPHDMGIKSDPLSDAYKAKFSFADFSPLHNPQPVAAIIRDIAAIFTSYAKHPFVTAAYGAFHSYLQLTDLAMDEFLEAFMSEESKNDDLAKSFLESQNHTVLNLGWDSFVFRITPFMSMHLGLVEERQRRSEQEEQMRQESEQREVFEQAIQNSRYQTFTYLMEDTRNGLIKIGKSKNPERREGTLQSEAPSIEMRFAIPADDYFERDLHAEFSDFRRRGEWFELSSLQLKLILERMLSSGDPSRVISSPEWVGRVFLAAHLNSSSNALSK